MLFFFLLKSIWWDSQNIQRLLTNAANSRKKKKKCWETLRELLLLHNKYYAFLLSTGLICSTKYWKVVPHTLAVQWVRHLLADKIPMLFFSRSSIYTKYSSEIHQKENWLLSSKHQESAHVGYKYSSNADKIWLFRSPSLADSPVIAQK